MGQNSSIDAKTLEGLNKLNIDASDSYVTEIGLSLKKGVIPISAIIKQEKCNKLKQKSNHLHINSKKDRKAVTFEGANVKNINCRNNNNEKLNGEIRQNKLPTKDEHVSKDYARMRSGGQNSNDLENSTNAEKLQKDLLKKKLSKEDQLKELYKNDDYLYHKHKKNKDNSDTKKPNAKEPKTVVNKAIERTEKVLKQQEAGGENKKPNKFVVETNVSCIVPPKHYYYYDGYPNRNTEAGRDSYCENTKCPCKKHECPYMSNHHQYQYDIISSMSQEELKATRAQSNLFRRNGGFCKRVHKTESTFRRDQLNDHCRSSTSMIQSNMRVKRPQENQLRKNCRARNEEKSLGKQQANRSGNCDKIPTETSEQIKKIVTPKEALETWKNIHSLRYHRNQPNLDQPSEAPDPNGDTSPRERRKNVPRNKSPAVQTLWPPNRRCCAKRTSSMLPTIQEHPREIRLKDDFHTNIERCLLQHGKRISDHCQENGYRHGRSTWIQDRHRKWHRVLVQD